MKIESSIELLNELIIALLIVEQRRTNELLGDLLSLARGRWR